MSLAPAFQAPAPVSLSGIPHSKPIYDRKRFPVCDLESPARQSNGDLIVRGFQNLTETRVPLRVSFDKPCPANLADHTFYRMTSALFELPHADGTMWRAEHWFDAIGAAHAFRIDPEAKSITYRSRVLNDLSVNDIISSTPSKFFPSQAVMPKPVNTMHKLRQIFRDVTRDNETGMPNMNVFTTVERVPGKGLTARTESNMGISLDPVTLEAQERFSFRDLHPKLGGEVAASHGRFDPETGEYFNYVADSLPGFGTKYTVFKIGKDGKPRILASFRDYLYLIHSFAVTKNYVVLMIYPAEINMAKVCVTKSFVSSLKMHRNRPTKFVVVSRQEEKVVATYEHEAFFSFHTINSFETEDSIVIDLSWYRDCDCVHMQTFDSILSGNSVTENRPMRFTLPEVSKARTRVPSIAQKATSRALANTFFEDTTVSPLVLGNPYRFAYGVSDAGEGGFFADIAKLDLLTGKVSRWGNEGSFYGEAIFVPNPNNSVEDEGCLLVNELDAIRERSSLVVIDAKTMTELTRATLPFVIPHGFHAHLEKNS